MAIKRHRAAQPSVVATGPSAQGDTADLNEIVAYNIRRARELRGWTQEEAAARLAPFLGQLLPQASISALERAYGGERRREFDAQEILAFACGFDLPLVWFFLPPPEDHRRLKAASESVTELTTLLLGRDDQLDDLDNRFRELGVTGPTEADQVWQRVTGQRRLGAGNDYRTWRKNLLLAMLDDGADELNKAADELGAFFDHLRQVGIRGFVSEHTLDPDYGLAPRHRGKIPAPSPPTRRRGGTPER